MPNYVGIDIGGTKMHLLAEYDGKYIEKRISTGIEATRSYLQKEIERFVLELPFNPKGIGIAIPGLVEDANQVIASDVVPSLNGLNANFFSLNNYQVSLINDVQAALLEEAAHYPDEFTITVIMNGTGIAAATKTNKKPILGAKNWAGELGFAPLSVAGEVYKVDSLSSGAAILEKAGTNLATFLLLLEKGDQRAIKIVNEAGFYFGLAMAFLINLLNPNIIVVGGSTTTYRGYMHTAIETARKYALKESFNICQVIEPKDLKRIVALGARRFAMKISEESKW